MQVIHRKPVPSVYVRSSPQKSTKMAGDPQKGDPDLCSGEFCSGRALLWISAYLGLFGLFALSASAPDTEAAAGITVPLPLGTNTAVMLRPWMNDPESCSRASR
jgi:hypothetical protein